MIFIKMQFIQLRTVCFLYAITPLMKHVMFFFYILIYFLNLNQNKSKIQLYDEVCILRLYCTYFHIIIPVFKSKFYIRLTRISKLASKILNFSSSNSLAVEHKKLY